MNKASGWPTDITKIVFCFIFLLLLLFVYFTKQKVWYTIHTDPMGFQEVSLSDGGAMLHHVFLYPVSLNYWSIHTYDRCFWGRLMHYILFWCNVHIWCWYVCVPDRYIPALQCSVELQTLVRWYSSVSAPQHQQHRSTDLKKCFFN